MLSEKEREYQRKYKATDKYKQTHKKYQREYNMRYVTINISKEVGKRLKELGAPHNKSYRDVMDIIFYFLDHNGFDIGPLLLEQELDAMDKRRSEILAALKKSQEVAKF